MIISHRLPAYSAAALITFLLLTVHAVSEAKTPASAKTGAKSAAYLSQTYIDTIIQRAFENFNTDISTAGQAEFKQREVIESAKAVVKKLRRIAKGNVNEKYILFKTSELEQQVYLEEKELYTKQEARRKKAVYALCDSFNIETGKKRPDFIALSRIVSQMANYDPGKADELDELILSRNRGISREIVSFIEYAFVHNEKERARAELDYASANRGILLIPPEKLSAYENRLQSTLDLDEMKRYINDDIQKLQARQEQNRFGNSSNTLFTLSERLKSITPRLAKKEVTYFTNGINGLRATLERKEDSLVQYGLLLINEKGVDAGKSYMNRVLYPSGVALSKIGLVDQTLLEIARALEKDVETPLTRELDRMAADMPANGEQLANDMVVAARKKAQARADSIRTAMVQYERIDSIRTASFKGSENKRKENEEKANTYVLIIYDRIDQGGIPEAYELYKRQRPFIEKFVLAETSATLNKTIELAYADYQKKITRK